MTGDARDRWRRVRARLGFGPAVTEIDAAEAYRLWSETYGDEINDLQRLEAELRRELIEEVRVVEPFDRGGHLRGARTLEVGAGTGRVTADLLSAGAEVFATDLVPEMLLGARTREEMAGRVCVARAEALPFEAASFDVLLCALTIGHVADLASALGSMVDVLRPGGAIVLTGFHPAATLRGWKRTFIHDGVEHAIEQHVHDLSEYARILASLDCPIEELQERAWEGSVVLFGLRARMASSTLAPGA